MHFEAFRLRMRYDRKNGLMECEVTITSEIVGTQHDAAAAAIGAAETGSRAGLRRAPTGNHAYGCTHDPTTHRCQPTIPFRFTIG